MLYINKAYVKRIIEIVGVGIYLAQVRAFMVKNE